MACRIISTKNDDLTLSSLNCPMKIIRFSARKCCRGMTLVETLVALGISSIALAALAAFAFYSARSFAAIGNYVELDNTSRKAVDLMTKEIRQTAALSDYRTNALTFTDYDGKPLLHLRSQRGNTDAGEGRRLHSPVDGMRQFRVSHVPAHPASRHEQFLCGNRRGPMQINRHAVEMLPVTFGQEREQRIRADRPG